MPETLFKKVDYSLSKLMYDIEYGEIGLPDIQRPFVWEMTKVRDLFDSMFKGFPVGYLLFWANEGSKAIGPDNKQKSPSLLIVDGQQRLTALYSVFKSKKIVDKDFKERTIKIAFRPKDSHFEVTDAAIEKDHEYISNISELWANGTSPFSFTTSFIDKQKEFYIKNQKLLTDEDINKLSNSISRLYEIQNYPFTAMEISPSIDEEQVAEVFVRINSKGVPLKQSDFILTLLSVFWDEGRKQLETFCFEAQKPSDLNKPSPFNYFIKPDPDHLLRAAVGLGFKRARLRYAYLLLRGKDLETEQFSEENRNRQFEILKQAQEKVLELTPWHEFLKSLMQAGFKSDSMISSKLTLVFAYIMFLIGKYEYKIELYDLKKVIARWFFFISLTRRYTGSPESVMEQDLVRLRDIKKDKESFVKVLDDIIKSELTDDFWNITLVNGDLVTSSVTSPALYAYYASLNILDARVLFSKLKVSELLDPAVSSKKASTERHHLFPKKHLNKMGISDVKITNQIANYALLEWYDNIKIMDDSPSIYFPKYKTRLDEKELEQQTYWHALPEGWENMTYDNFLTERRKLIAKVIKDGFDNL